MPVSRLGIVPSVLPPAFPLDLSADPTTPSSRRKFELWCQPQRASHFVVPSLFGSQRRWVPAPQLDAASTFRGFPRDRYPPFNQIFHPISLPTTFVSKPARLTPSRRTSEAYWVRRSLTGSADTLLRHSSSRSSIKFCQSPARVTPVRSTSGASWVRR